MKASEILEQVKKALGPVNTAVQPVRDFLESKGKPTYLKEGELMYKAVQRFLNYRRDLLKPDELEEITETNRQLIEAVKAKDKEGVEAHIQKLRVVCEKAAPKNYRASVLAENIEVVFVAMAIALGIRAYIAQPFKIPTGSMQPTLNGIIAHSTDGDQPNAVVKLIDKVRLGRSWVDVVVQEDDTIVDVEEVTKFKFFTHTRVVGQKHIYKVNAPMRQALETLGLRDIVSWKYNSATGRSEFVPSPVVKGQVLARGYVDTGDQVIVDKFSYHFFPPRRGEVFVFTTKGIRGIDEVDPRMGSIHYIKRLAGVPGDEVKIADGNLYINGEEAKEHGFRRVMSQEGDYNGYIGLYSNSLQADQYLALGDNSGNSKDSRFWGHVPEENLVGRALIVYWPFNSHWGIIR